jgi:hypothetical protein
MKISSIAAIICSGLLLNALIRQPPPGSAQARSKPPQIESGLLAELRAGRSVMFVGAHPDDETTLGPLLARASEQTKVIVASHPSQVGQDLAQPAFAARIRRQIEQTAVILAASEPKIAVDDKTQPPQPRD